MFSGGRSNKKTQSPLHSHSDKKLREVTSFTRQEFQILHSVALEEPEPRSDRSEAMVLVSKGLSDPHSDYCRFGGLHNIRGFRVLKNVDETDKKVYVVPLWTRSYAELTKEAKQREEVLKAKQAADSKRKELEKQFNDALEQAKKKASKSFHRKFPNVEGIKRDR